MSFQESIVLTPVATTWTRYTGQDISNAKDPHDREARKLVLRVWPDVASRAASLATVEFYRGYVPENRICLVDDREVHHAILTDRSARRPERCTPLP